MASISVSWAWSSQTHLIGWDINAGLESSGLTSWAYVRAHTHWQYNDVANWHKKHGYFKLQWRYDKHDDISNHRRLDCFSKFSSSADQREHQSSASLAPVRGIHRRPVDSPHKGPVTWKMFPFEEVIMTCAPAIVFYHKPYLVSTLCNSSSASWI